MKYIILLGDGMSDRPIPGLDNKTPLEAADKPNMDMLAARGLCGMVNTIPPGLPAGSDVANLSIFGYDPAKYYTGRSPLEAASMGINLGSSDTAFRCNLVTLSPAENFNERVMIDHSSGEITNEGAAELMAAIRKELSSGDIEFYTGVSYRHCMIWRGCPIDFGPSPLTPPHDILDRQIGQYLPGGKNGGRLLDLIKRSWAILEKHPVNISRKQRGLNPANSIWFWGEGRKPAVDSFRDKYGLKGSVISAVDLIKGIGVCAGLKPVKVEGATGNISTNFKGKAEAALSELDAGADLVYIHVEAPDECGHQGDINNKIRAIELIDHLVLGTLLSGLEKYEDYSILLLPDHSTPIELRTHVADPVPFVLYRKSADAAGTLDSGGGCCDRSGSENSNDVKSSFDKIRSDKSSNVKSYNVNCYSEAAAKQSGLWINEGHTLMDLLIKGE